MIIYWDQTKRTSIDSGGLQRTIVINHNSVPKAALFLLTSDILITSIDISTVKMQRISDDYTQDGAENWDEIMVRPWVRHYTAKKPP